MSEYTDDAIGWKNTIQAAIETVRAAFDRLGEATIDELDDANDSLESEIEDLEGSLPCDEGIVEFINSLESNHDECYNMEDVAITVDQLHNEAHDGTWGIEGEHQLVSFNDLADVLGQLLDATKIRRTRIGLKGLILKLEDESFRSSDDTDEFVEAYTEFMS